MPMGPMLLWAPVLRSLCSAAACHAAAIKRLFDVYVRIALLSGAGSGLRAGPRCSEQFRRRLPDRISGTTETFPRFYQSAVTPPCGQP
jgi:hypothetical protein